MCEIKNGISLAYRILLRRSRVENVLKDQKSKQFTFSCVSHLLGLTYFLRYNTLHQNPLPPLPTCGKYGLFTVSKDAK